VIETVSVSGVWLRKIGSSVQVLVEVDGEWRLVAEELNDGNYSTIVEPSGVRSSPVDDKTARIG
jgi:hypothetical protein